MIEKCKGVEYKLKINQDIIKETNKLWGFEYMTALCMEEFAEVV